MSIRTKKIVEQTKASFLTLCEQYSRLGEILQIHAEALRSDPHDVNKHSSFQATLAQYQEIGEQLKTVGTCIDLLGGKSVMTGAPAMRVISGTRNELKKQGIHLPRIPR